MIQEKEKEFKNGKRHLAKIMGLHPLDEKFEQEDINVNKIKKKILNLIEIISFIESNFLSSTLRFNISQS